MQNKNEQENYFQSIHPPVFSIGGQMSANAQTTTPFETVFDACKKACEALDGGFASGEQLLAVSKTLRDAAPIPLTVKQTKGDVLSLKGHLVFDYEFIQACVDNETIYEIADKYAAEARTRGDKDSANKVRLDTKWWLPVRPVLSRFRAVREPRR